MLPAPEPILVIACGALAHEIVALKRSSGWEHLHLSCIDARLHNRPEKIAPALRARIVKLRSEYSRIFVAYGDCGSRGAIDRLLDEEGIERLPGAHCYQFLAGEERFEALNDAEPGTFYLTDFLVRHFQNLVVASLKIDQHPELLELYFGNYTRLLYLAQTHDPSLRARARAAADFLGLRFEMLDTGYGELRSGLQHFVMTAKHEKDTRLLA